MSRKRRQARQDLLKIESNEHSYEFRWRRSRADWAGVSLGDAFKTNLDYHVRLPAQRLFYQTVKRVQMAAAELAGVPAESFKPAVKPQLSPCYTNYPSALAAQAAIGLTGFLEFQERVSGGLLFSYLREYLQDPARLDRVDVDREIYKRIAGIVTKSIQTRLLLEDLSRLASMSPVETYRLFCASEQKLKFRSVPEIVDSVILYGDILLWQETELHPVSRSLLRDLMTTCQPFFDRLASTQPQGIVKLGAEWVKAVCLCLAKYLPGAGEKRREDANGSRLADLFRRLLGKMLERFQSYRFDKEETQPLSTDQVAPLDGPNPPSLFDPPSLSEQIARSLLESESDSDPEPETSESGSMTEEDGRRVLAPFDESSLRSSTRKLIKNFSDAVNKAGAQQSNFEDMRSDLVEHVLRERGFAEGPIQGNLVESHEVKIHMEGREVSGEIFDSPVELSDDLNGYERLLKQSRPITEAMMRTLYPNIEQIPETEHLRTSGTLDPARLAMADFSSAIFKRYSMNERVDQRGRPVLLIVCDSSGSLQNLQMRMVKILASAWLNSTVRTGIKIMAGLYHTVEIRPGVTGPLVQWIYHPYKTPATSRKEAARALVSLPETGTGDQADALSLAFMLEEARRLARGKMIYLILISDCKWVRSFNIGKSAQQEVYSFFENAYRELPEKLHTTLVALGSNGDTGFERLLDKVIKVPDKNLNDYAAVAGQIGIYVASCMKERSRMISRR